MADDDDDEAFWFLFMFVSPGTRRIGPSGNLDVGLDAHVADAHGGPPRHRTRAVRQHGAGAHGSLRGFRAVRPGAGNGAREQDEKRGCYSITVTDFLLYGRYTHNINFRKRQMLKSDVGYQVTRTLV